MSHRPDFVDNRDGNTLGLAVTECLKHELATRKDPPAAWIATSYFRPEGFPLIADALEQVREVRLLLGAEPERRPPRPRKLEEDAGRYQAALVDEALKALQRGPVAGHDLPRPAPARRPTRRGLGRRNVPGAEAEGRERVRRIPHQTAGAGSVGEAGLRQIVAGLSAAPDRRRTKRRRTAADGGRLGCSGTGSGSHIVADAVVLDRDKLGRREFYRQFWAAAKAGLPVRVETQRETAAGLPMDPKLLLAVASKAGRLVVNGVAGVAAVVEGVAALAAGLTAGVAAFPPYGSYWL